MTLNGEAGGLEVDEEAGWNVYSRFVEIAPGATAMFEVRLEGGVVRPDEVVTWVQPLARPLQVGNPGGAAEGG